MAETKRRTQTRICSRCGTTERCAAGGLPPGWSMEATDARVSFLCPTCVRANLRSIEGKLPEDYWTY